MEKQEKKITELKEMSIQLIKSIKEQGKLLEVNDKIIKKYCSSNPFVHCEKCCPINKESCENEK